VYCTVRRRLRALAAREGAIRIAGDIAIGVDRRKVAGGLRGNAGGWRCMNGAADATIAQSNSRGSFGIFSKSL
jgi:hypothetical protein